MSAASMKRQDVPAGKVRKGALLVQARPPKVTGVVESISKEFEVTPRQMPQNVRQMS